MEEWTDGGVPKLVAMASRSKWAYEVETWGSRDIWSGVGSETQSKSEPCLHPKSCLYIPFTATHLWLLRQSQSARCSFLF